MPGPAFIKCALHCTALQCTLLHRTALHFSQNVLLWIFLEIRYLIWGYGELSCLLVGSGQIPLNIELKQDDYTVCCIHSVVWGQGKIVG